MDAFSGERVREGTLACRECEKRYPVIRYIPRFVPIENYASSFGLEWLRHARTQYDAESGTSLSQDRFFGETGWPRQMPGEIVVEVGCGSGRFTEQAVSTGATVLSLDLSYAVEANYATHGDLSNVLIVQGDMYKMPFPRAYADRLFCFGVLQATPDPRQAFLSLPRHVRPGGEIVADVYLRSFRAVVLHSKYWVRPFTRRMDPERLYRHVQRYVDLMWPIASLIRRIPRIGASINWRLLVADYSDTGLTGSKLKEWAYLDTYDMLAPLYDQPQTLKTVEKWLEEARLEDARASNGFNGIELRGKLPLTDVGGTKAATP